jgi:hypothetical protein
MLTNDVNKSSRLITISEENSIRIFNRKNATQLTCVLPIPDINSLDQLHSIAYSRSVDTLYILLDNKDIWIYYTK